MARDHDEHVTAIIDRLVDAIEAREAYDPDLPPWETQRIRELERELARSWVATRRRDDAAPRPMTMAGAGR